MRVISSPTLRRDATIKASATVPAEMTISVSVSRTRMQKIRLRFPKETLK